MNRVVNSVQQILTECNSMIEFTKDCEFFDVKSLAKTLEEKCSMLKDLYDNSPDKEHEIAMAKAEVEDVAIRLEFYMDVRMGQYTERRKLRKFANTFYEDIRAICQEVSIHPEKYTKEQVLHWGTEAKWAISFYARSLHIIFETDDDDNTKIQEIVNEVKQFKEDVKL